MSTASLQQQLQSARIEGSDVLARLRKDAFQSFSEVGFPTRRLEDWRYTDLKLLAEKELDLRPATSDADRDTELARMLATMQLDSKAPALVFVNGSYRPTLSRWVERADVAVRNLAEHWDHLDTSKLLADAPHTLASLNFALADQGVHVAVAPGVRLEQPLHCIFLGERAGIAPQPRIIIDLGRGAELALVQHFVDRVGGGEAWLNIVTQVRQAPDSKLELYRLQEHGADQFHTSLLRAELDRGACLTAGYFDIGGRLVRNDVDVTLAGPEASVDLFGLYLASQGQHIDDHLRVDHAAAHTTSRQEFRGIIGEQGRAVFNGKVLVRPDSQHIDAQQRNDNLLLGENAEIDTKPELEIYADDVKCSHGTTVGEIDPRQLFYLRARGIDEKTARGLLTQAFAKRSLSRIRLAELADRVALRVAGHLPDRELAEALL